MYASGKSVTRRNNGVIRMLTLVALLACMWLAPLAPTRSTAAQESPYAWIQQEMIEIRGLPLLHEVKERYITREEFRAELDNTEIADEVRTQTEGAERTMIALGLIPAGTDLFGATLEEQATGVVGYYDPDVKEMVMISDSGGTDPLAQITYAHEFVHALQDQHFDLNALQDQVEALDDSEAATAFRALVEGDATVAQFQFMIRHPELVSALDFSDTESASSPPVITEAIMFPYLAGSQFVTRLLREGIWEEVNIAYGHLPVSTEQILHFDRYVDGDTPQDVSVPDIGSTLGRGWSIADQDIVGELVVMLMFAEEQPGQQSGFTAGFPDVATIAAGGWDGDRYTTWVKGEQTVIVWQSAWDSRADAREFAGTMADYDAGRSGATAQGTASITAIDGNEWSSRIVRSGDQVTYVLAPTAELADDVLASVRDAA